MSKPSNPTYNLPPAYTPNYEYLPAIVQKYVCPRGSGAPYATKSLYECLWNMNYKLNAYNESGKEKPIRKSIRTLAFEMDLPKTAIHNSIEWLKNKEWIDVIMEKNTTVIYLNIDKMTPFIWRHYERLRDPKPQTSNVTVKPKSTIVEDDGAEPRGDYSALFQHQQL